MKDSWRTFFRRVAVTSVFSSSVAWSSAMCYAVQLAFDSASDPVYADGWQGTATDNTTGAVTSTGDNGGFGFEPWNFDTDWLFNPDPIDGIQAIDDGLKSGGGNPNSSSFNNIGRAWRIAVPPPDGENGGLPRAGRGFPALQVGQTLRVLIDNPTDKQFFKGYFVRFNSRGGEAGGGNICYDYPGYSTACSAADLNGDGNNVPLGATPEPKLEIRQFEYLDNSGQWSIFDQANEGHLTELFDTDTAQAGAQIDLTITGPDTYSVTIDPLGPAQLHTQTGMLQTPGEPIDWIEFTFFNTITDPGFETDFYVRSMEIIGDAPPGVAADYSDNDVVDAADYTVWRDHLGTNFQLTNEVAGVTPGSVTQQDYDEWKSRFGSSTGAGLGSGPGGAAVPEPSTVLYVVGALGGILCGARRVRA